MLGSCDSLSDFDATFYLHEQTLTSTTKLTSTLFTNLAEWAGVDGSYYDGSDNDEDDARETYNRRYW